jgi:hypothetical protein
LFGDHTGNILAKALVAYILEAEQPFWYFSPDKIPIWLLYIFPA